MSLPSGYLPAAVFGAAAGAVAAYEFVAGPPSPNSRDQHYRSQHPQSRQRPYPSSSNTNRAPMSSTAPPAAVHGGRFTEARRSELRKIGEETMEAIQHGSYSIRGVDHPLKEKIRDSKRNTVFYSFDSALDQWESSPKPQTVGDSTPSSTHISVLEISTMEAAQLLDNTIKNNSEEGSIIGVLNFASATKPGGGFQNGAEAQEESIARASTLYPCLMTDEAQKFYKTHRIENEHNKAAFYTHAMIYSPRITVFRDDDGGWTPPFNIDVLTCAAVNAGEILKNVKGPNTSGISVTIEKVMTERMGRILFLFEQHGARNIVLGTFGTGVFRNDLATVTRIWASLLLRPNARFRDSFDRIIFAITGENTFSNFKTAFEAWGESKASAPQNGSKGRRVIDKIIY